jgi:hypothetical protein
MSVREQRPLREALYFGVVVVALGVAVYLAYANGRATSAMQHLSASDERDRLVSEVDRLESQGRGFRERIAVLERTGQIERKAYADVDEDLKDLEDEIFDLKEEVAFYRDIVSAQRNKGLNIQSLDILPVGSGSDYRYRLVLTKDMRNDKVVTGKVNLSVEGEYDGKSKRLPFSELLGRESSDIEFQFRYFQKLEGQIRLPDGFYPHSVLVEVVAGEKSKKRTAERQFNWPQPVT